MCATVRRLFDTHCHIGLKGDDCLPAFQRAVANRVMALTIVGIDAASSRQAQRNAAALMQQAQQQCRSSGDDGQVVWKGRAFWTGGIHPHNANRFAAEFSEIAKMCGENRDTCVAVGESGLDLCKSETSLDDQLINFRGHLRLARELEKPIVIHSRDADEKMLEVLRAFAPLRGVMHCFSSDARFMEQVLRMGLYISFSGKITYRGLAAKELREACLLCPLDRIVIETDAPFLTPAARPKGVRNEPAFVEDVFVKVAELKAGSHTVAEIEAQLWENSCRLFNVGTDEAVS